MSELDLTKAYPIPQKLIMFPEPSRHWRFVLRELPEIPPLAGQYLTETIEMKEYFLAPQQLLFRFRNGMWLYQWVAWHSETRTLCVTPVDRVPPVREMELEQNWQYHVLRDKFARPRK